MLDKLARSAYNLIVTIPQRLGIMELFTPHEDYDVWTVSKASALVGSWLTRVRRWSYATTPLRQLLDKVKAAENTKLLRVFLYMRGFMFVLSQTLCTSLLTVSRYEVKKGTLNPIDDQDEELYKGIEIKKYGGGEVKEISATRG